MKFDANGTGLERHARDDEVLHVLRRDLCTCCCEVFCSGIVFVSREQTRIVLRSVMPVETYPVDVEMQSSTGLPILDPGEKVQNIVEIPTVPEHVICSGNGACGIQSGATGAYVHRPGNLLCQIRSTDCESIAELLRKTLMRCCRGLCGHFHGDLRAVLQQ